MGGSIKIPLNPLSKFCASQLGFNWLLLLVRITIEFLGKRETSCDFPWTRETAPGRNFKHSIPLERLPGHNSDFLIKVRLLVLVR